METEYVWVYHPRNAEVRVFRHFATARAEQESDNVFTLDQLIEMDPEIEYSGSEEAGFFYIEDGGSITKVWIE